MQAWALCPERLENNLQRPPFPAQIDNTMRSAFRACERKFWLRFMRGFAPGLPSVHLHAGQAFAKGLEVTRLAFFQDGLPAEDAIALGWAALIEHYGDFETPTPEHSKSAHRLGEALVSYFDEYPLGVDPLKPAVFHGRPAVEFTFAIPLPIMHPETGEPILYCGRFDMLGEVNGQLFVVDEKTTGSLGEHWAKRYELSAQFTGYCWAARQYGYQVVGAIIRGVGILKYEVKHAAIPLFRQDFHIDEWYAALLLDVERMIEAWRQTGKNGENQWSEWQPDLADACGSFGGCEFLPVCGIHQQSREKMLEINFAVREWTPLQMESE